MSNFSPDPFLADKEGGEEEGSVSKRTIYRKSSSLPEIIINAVRFKFRSTRYIKRFYLLFHTLTNIQHLY